MIWIYIILHQLVIIVFLALWLVFLQISISQENTNSVSATLSALPGIQISGNSVVNVYYNSYTI